jgi:predicted PurR-regulated permease PerM
MVGWRIALWAVIVLATLSFLYLVRGILLPFIVALILSALLDPAIRRLRMRGYSRRAAVLTVWSLFMGLILGLGLWLTPTVSRQLGNFRVNLDQITRSLAESTARDNFFLKWNPSVRFQEGGATGQVDRFFEQYRDQLQRLGLPGTRREAVEQYIEPHKREITAAAQSFFSGLLGFLAGIGSQALLMLFAPLFVLLILLDLEKFKRRFASWIPPSIRADTVQLITDVGEVFVKYLRGVTIVLLWYVAIASVLLTVLGAPYSILLAILFALIYLIPYIGPVIIALLLFLVTGVSGVTGNFIFDLGNPWAYAATIALIYAVIMFFFDPLVYTRIVGGAVGLHPVVSFFVVFSGAALFGPIGMILAFPVAGSIKVILDRMLRITSEYDESLELPPVPLRHRSA